MYIVWVCACVESTFNKRTFTNKWHSSLSGCVFVYIEHFPHCKLALKFSPIGLLMF